jgi:hypothetical protein
MERTITGTLVAISVFAYDSFTGGDGSTVAAGESHTIWLIEDPAQEPTAIKVEASQAAELQTMIGKKVRVTARVNAKNNRLVFRAKAGTLTAA